MKFIYTILVLTLASCSGGSKESTPTLEQTRASQLARDGWRKELRPLEMEANVQGVSRIGMKVMAEGSTDFVPFHSIGNSKFAAEQPSWTADTASVAYGCYPVESADLVELKAPFSERLYGVETARSMGEKLNLKMDFKSSMALLRFSFESNNIKDILESLTLTGSEMATNGKYEPYNGKWTESGGKGLPVRLHVDRLLNSCSNCDFYLVPADVDQNIVLVAMVGGKEYSYSTKIPPVSPGSMTQINLALGKTLTVKSSWVDNERKLAVSSVTPVDSVKVGNYLRRDGLVVAKRDTMSVAVVIETNGKHGKAVAIEDYPSLCSFGHKTLTSNRLFNTIDGQRTEGVINNADSSEDEHLVFKPDMPYNEKCAFGYADGASLTGALKVSVVRHDEQSMLTATEKNPCSYVPSLAEMAKLYYLLQPYAHSTIGSLIEPLSGEYITCTESTEHTFYGIEMSKGIVMCNYSKGYAQLKLRLFYLF